MHETRPSAADPSASMSVDRAWRLRARAALPADALPEPLARRLLVVVLILLVLRVAEGLAPGHDDAEGAEAVPVPQLLDGVSSMATGGNPASLVAWGPARVLSVRDDGTVLAAASTLGRGRVACLGHGGYLDDERGTTPRLIANLAIWLGRAGAGADAGDEARPLRVAGLGEPALAVLRAAGHDVRAVADGPRRLDLSQVDVVAGSPQAWAGVGGGRLEALEAWIRGGGGMLVTETAWGQLQLGRAASVEALAANRLLAPAGIMFTAAAESAGREGTYPAGPADDPRLVQANAERALAVLAGEAPGSAAFAARIARDALALVPLDGPLVAAADRLRRDRAPDLAAAWAGMARRPLRPAEQPLALALLDLDGRRAAAAAPEAMVAHPSAVAFPGAVDPEHAAAGGGPHVLTLDPSIPGWRSTGLYAVPGQPVTVRFTGSWGEVAAAETGGLHLQVGVWRDPQNFADRVRMPQAIHRAAVTSAETTIASPIGGPLLLDLPAAFSAARPEDDSLDIVVTGAVPMPHFVRGVTDVAEWREEIRHRGAPWAEFESDELVLTVPAEAVRDVDDPDVVMAHWDRVHAAMHELQPRSANHWPDRQYRYVADRKLSWGYMYCPANDPIVIPMSAAARMFDPVNFDAEGDFELWGHYHEMGHAHQDRMWTFGGTGEVTVNIFTVYAMTQVNGYRADHPATRSDPATAWRRFEEHLAAGAPFEKWKGDPFLALQTYAMLWHAFGFDAYERAFRAYDDLAASRRPSDDAAKRDLFMVTMSRAVGRNLGPYFRSWGVPISAAAMAEVGALPGWMPVEPGQ